MAFFLWSILIPERYVRGAQRAGRVRASLGMVKSDSIAALTSINSHAGGP